MTYSLDSQEYVCRKILLYIDWIKYCKFYCLCPEDCELYNGWKKKHIKYYENFDISQCDKIDMCTYEEYLKWKTKLEIKCKLFEECYSCSNSFSDSSDSCSDDDTPCPPPNSPCYPCKPSRPPCHEKPPCPPKPPCHENPPCPPKPPCHEKPPCPPCPEKVW